MQEKSVVVIVAHPDDETLWTGGTILSHPSWKCFIVCVCRRSDPDRSQKFFQALKILKSEGIMGDLDDGPDQHPLDESELESAILNLLPARHFDLIITHNPNGEYTRHRRHEEIGKAVRMLWDKTKIEADELWTFAYEDGGGKYYPKAVETAPVYRMLTNHIWKRKFKLINEIYGFEKPGWEAETTPRAEAFWQYTDANDAQKWLNHLRNE